jgi:hypothetical protein
VILRGPVLVVYLELPETAHGEVWLHLLGGVQHDPREVLKVLQVLGIKVGQGVLKQSQSMLLMIYVDCMVRKTPHVVWF